MALLAFILSNYGRYNLDRLESMTTLVAAVDAGSLSAAARRLGMPLATVSRKVSELEEHLHTQLLYRSSRKLTLTDAGRSYLASCKRILGDISEAERTAMGEYSSPKGELVVTAPIVLGRLHALPIVSEFLRVYPDIDVRLVLSDRVANLLEEHVDVAIRVGELPDSSMVATRVGAIHRAVSASPEYLARRGTPTRLEELSRHDCVTFEGVSAPESWAFTRHKSTVTVPIHSRLVVNSAEAAIDAAVAGVGITRVFSYQLAAAERAGALRRILRALEPSATPVNFVYTGQVHVPLKLRAFLDFAAPRLKAALARDNSANELAKK
jgi:DNA-binding transcriptional LysR family regulator